MRFPLLSKAAALAIVILLLLLALARVDDVIRARQWHQRAAEQGLQDSLASPQTVLGPVMQMRCEETWERVEGEGKDRKMVSERRDHVVTAWPRTLSVDGSAAIEPRYRGLFKLNGYLAKHTLRAEWEPLAPPRRSAEQAGSRMTCQLPTIAVALSDARGIRSATVKFGEQVLAVAPGSLLATQPQGFHATLPGVADVPFALDIGLELAGTRQLAWVPVAQQNKLTLHSPWPHPSFGGRFLPVDRQVSEQGFKSTWQVSALATTAQHAVQAGAALCGLHEDGEVAGTAARYEAAPAKEGRLAPCIDTFGVAFIDPVNGYLLNERATKYGLLFITLTFVVVALVEVMRRLRVHPVQYLLVGCALTVFFLLLLSLSEHLPFWQAYLAAAAACTALLAYYGAHVLQGAKAGAAFGAGIATLYAALYALLQMEQTALVLGSMLLFAVLAALMVATRRIDWYALATQLRQEASGTARVTPTVGAV